MLMLGSAGPIRATAHSIPDVCYRIRKPLLGSETSNNNFEFLLRQLALIGHVVLFWHDSAPFRTDHPVTDVSRRATALLRICLRRQSRTVMAITKCLIPAPSVNRF